jgi:cytochrome oxidase assembly protein ShyY1
VNDTFGLNSSSSVSPVSPKKHSRLGIELGVGLGMVALVLILIGLGYWNMRRAHTKRAAKNAAISLDDLKP